MKPTSEPMKRTTPKCPECEERYLQPATATLRGTTHSESFSIVTDALICPNCGFKTIPTAKMGEFALRVTDAYREKHGLLTSHQIKNRRLGLGMSQQKFAKYLGVGSSSVKRWELGWIQDKAMNDLMLLRTDPRAAQANLVEVLSRLGKSPAAQRVIP
jgi:putative zinc finger/helix-turn-helix YgiT family protein